MGGYANINKTAINEYLKQVAQRDSLWQVMLSRSAQVTGFARRQDEKAAINSSSVVGKISLTSQMARQMQNLIACSGLTSYVFVRVLAGRISGKLSGRPLNVEAGSVLVFDCSRVSQADVEVECELQYLAIPKLDIRARPKIKLSDFSSL